MICRIFSWLTDDGNVPDISPIFVVTVTSLFPGRFSMIPVSVVYSVTPFSV
jgi:hypothetical protein